MSLLSGFEGFEKRLELHFTSSSSSSGNDDNHDYFNLRLLPVRELEEILTAVQCTIVSSAGNSHFDSYILSESSLFIYPFKIIIKTCGTTQLLNSLPLLLSSASPSLRLSSLRYSRGKFIFPSSQPFPYTSFSDEIGILNTFLPPQLLFKKASVLPPSWHVFTASEQGDQLPNNCCNSFTIEVCMTGLDRVKAERFYHREENNEFSADEVGGRMSAETGIDRINANAVVFGYAFDPCGYSMNGIDGERYETIHVTPENGFSYASFECVGDGEGMEGMLERAVEVFRPTEVTVAVTGPGEVAVAIGRMECGSRITEVFPGAGAVTYQTFTLPAEKLS